MMKVKILICTLGFLPADVLPEKASVGLVDPMIQPLFEEQVPNPLDPSFIYNTSSGQIDISVSEGVSITGLVAEDGTLLKTRIWGYGTHDAGYTWPGRTLVARSYEPLRIQWRNEIALYAGYLLTGKDNSHLGPDHDFSRVSVVDDSFHWAYSLEGYEDYSIEEHGTPIVPHLHGGHNDAAFDGNPEYFFTPEWNIMGPQWGHRTFVYDNSQPASTLWYHDHALGITRLNVYSGMAGFYILRDDQDTGEQDNPLKLPAFPYEAAFAIQDRMFKVNGELFYPSFHGDPFWEDFVEGEGASINSDDSSAMAEMFGDIMVVNGKIWPKMNVEPRHYRLRFLNGCDSRFLVLQFVAVDLDATDFEDATPLDFTVIGSDQGLGPRVRSNTIVVGPAERYDIVFDFSPYVDRRIIIKNLGGDEPFGGEVPGPQIFELTDRVMAFDVTKSFDESIPDEFVDAVQSVEFQEQIIPDRLRRLGLFEGHDQFGRLQPLLGTIGPARDMDGEPICYPNTEEYEDADLVGPMEGTMTWHGPTTENIKLNDIEDWEIWNLSADAHPVHLHLVHFTLVKREYIKFDSASVDGEIGEVEPEGLEGVAGDGTYYTDMPLVEHDGSLGEGYYAVNPTKEPGLVDENSDEFKIYVDKFPKDVIVALPGQVTTIRAKFDKPGRFNWHCHILAHEDHEMMRIFHVGELPDNQKGGTCPPEAIDSSTSTSSEEKDETISANGSGTESGGSSEDGSTIEGDSTPGISASAISPAWKIWTILISSIVCLITH